VSIIYDALKKVEERIESSNQANLGVKLYGDHKPNRKIYILYAILTALAVTIIVSVFVRFTPHSLDLPRTANPAVTKKAPPEPVTEQPAAATSQEAAKVEPAPPPVQPPKPPQPTLNLNGVFFSGDEGYALINNQIVKEGDGIEGATVERISMSGVELKNGDGSITNLPSK
jgi:type II secretory pathway component PulC